MAITARNIFANRFTMNGSTSLATFTTVAGAMYIFYFMTDDSTYTGDVTPGGVGTWTRISYTASRASIWICTASSSGSATITGTTSTQVIGGVGCDELVGAASNTPVQNAYTATGGNPVSVTLSAFARASNYTYLCSVMHVFGSGTTTALNSGYTKIADVADTSNQYHITSGLNPANDTGPRVTGTGSFYSSNQMIGTFEISYAASGKGRRYTFILGT